jgi:hypothetical protein
MTPGQYTAAQTLAVVCDPYVLEPVRDDCRRRLDTLMREGDADTVFTLSAALFAFTCWLPSDDPIRTGADWTLAHFDFLIDDVTLLTRPRPATPVRQVRSLLDAALVDLEATVNAVMGLGPTVRARHVRTALQMQLVRLRVYGRADMRSEMHALLTTILEDEPLDFFLFIAKRGRIETGLYPAMARPRPRPLNPVDDPPF